MSDFQHPHDSFFTYLFSQPRIVQGVLEEMVGDLSQHLDLKTLMLDTTSYVNDQLKNLYSDIVYKCHLKTENENKTVKIALLFEHKSYPPRYPHLQLMEYMVNVFRQNVENQMPLMPVIPVIFYHGTRKWNKKTFRDEFPQLLPKLKKYIPDFEFYLIDLNDYDDETLLELQTHFLANAMLAFKHKNDSDYIMTHYWRLFHKLEEYLDSETGEKFIHYLSVYLIATTKITDTGIRKIVADLPPKMENKMLTTYENIMNKGIEKGIERGIKLGSKSAAILTQIKLSIHLMQKGTDLALFLDVFDELNEKTIELLKLNVQQEFKTLAFQEALATHLMITFEYLLEEDIAKICQLKLEDVQAIKDSIAKKAK